MLVKTCYEFKIDANNTTEFKKQPATGSIL